jgi:CheY-like chemotaxis protein
MTRHPADKLILLVEDNRDDVDLMRMALAKSNVQASMHVVRDGQEALDYLFGTGEPAAEPPRIPDLILLDLKLPRIDGLEVLRRLRGHPSTRLLPVVILTSSTAEQDVVRGYELGANSYVNKPVDFLKFVEAARALGVYWLELNVPIEHTPPDRARNS